VYFLSVAGLIACKDVSLFEAFSCLWTPSSTFYKLLKIKRLWNTNPMVGNQRPGMIDWLLELGAARVARPVLRGGGGSEATSLPNHIEDLQEEMDESERSSPVLLW